MSPILAEFLGTALLILFGDGVVANVVLSRSKGQNSGWVGIAAGGGGGGDDGGLLRHRLERVALEPRRHDCGGGNWEVRMVARPRVRARADNGRVSRRRSRVADLSTALATDRRQGRGAG